MVHKLHMNVFGVLLTALSSLSFGQPGITTTCADTLTSLTGKPVGDMGSAAWEVSTLSLAEVLTSYGVTVTPEMLSLNESGDVEPLAGAACIGIYLFTNEIDSEKQTVYLNVYDTSLEKRVASIETFGLPTEGWIIGDVVAANLYAYFMGETSIVLSLATQQVLSDTPPSRFTWSKIFMVSGDKLLRERTSSIGGPQLRHIESLVIDGNSLTVVASCPVTLSEEADNLQELEYMLDKDGLKAGPKGATNSESFQLIAACQSLAKTFPISGN